MEPSWGRISRPSDGVVLNRPGRTAGNVIELVADAELGSDRNAVIRVTISDRAEGSPRDAAQRVILGDPKSPGYEAFRAHIAEYVSLLPPNSHGEANPADKDPVPPPFDNTYNSPEHDAFVMNVKYQRNDRFFTENIVDGADRVRLNQAWNDLFGSWPYHDAYLGMLADHYKLQLKSRRIQDMDDAQIAALPAAVRPHVISLRAHYDEVMKAQALAQPGHVADALTFASRAWRRPHGGREGESSGFLSAVSVKSITTRPSGLLARIYSPAFLYRLRRMRAPGQKKRPLSAWERAG